MFFEGEGGAYVQHRANKHCPDRGLGVLQMVPSQQVTILYRQPRSEEACQCIKQYLKQNGKKTDIYSFLHSLLYSICCGILGSVCTGVLPC